MEINVCPGCGAVFKPKARDCAGCGSVQSRFAATAVSTMAGSVAPMVVSVAPDRLILERIVTNRQTNALVPAGTFYGGESYVEESYSGNNSSDSSGEFYESFGATEASAAPGNGNGNGNGNGRESADSFFDNDFAPTTAQGNRDVNVFIPSPAQEERETFSRNNMRDYDEEAERRNPNPSLVVDDQGQDEVVHDEGGEEEQSTNGSRGDNFNFVPASPSDNEQSPFFSGAAPNEEAEYEEQPAITSSNSQQNFAPQQTAEPMAAPAPQAQIHDAPNPVQQVNHNETVAVNVVAPSINIQEKPSRPQIAGPAEFARNKTDSSEVTSTSNYRAPAAATAEAFDFFQSGNAPAPKPAASPSRSSRPETSSGGGGGGGDDPHSDFESLLTKSSKSGSYKQAEGIKKPGRRNGKGQSDTGSNYDDEQNEMDEEEEEERNAKPRRSNAKVAAKSRSYDEDDDDDEDEDEQPRRSKASAGKKSSSGGVIKKPKYDDDDEDDDDDEEPREIPQRRSFSGSASSLRKIDNKSSRRPSASASRSNMRKSKDDDDDEDDDAKGNLRKKMSNDGLFKVAGFPIGFKLVGIGAGMVAMLAFVFFHIANNLAVITPQAGGPTGTPSSAMGGLLPDTPKVAGLWEMNVKHEGATYPNKMDLHQRGSQVYGQGLDLKVGPYEVTGEVKTIQGLPAILFKKQFYDRNKRASGPPIYFQGQLYLDTIPLQAAGQWEFTKPSKGGGFGHLNKPTKAKATGEWIAQLRRPSPIDTGDTPLPQQMLSSGSTTPTDNKKFNLIDFVVHNGIFVAIGVGVALIGGSATLFGPSGLINIWAKQQYIPSQFKAQHGKIRAQLAKPVKKGSLPLGQRLEWKWWFPAPWVIKDLAIPPDMRKINPHLLILGQGGKGKSRLIAKMIAHDIESDDRAVVLVDSDGSLVDLMVQWISAHPRGREIAKRVVIIDPTYKAGSVAYNPLNLPDVGDLQTAAASIVDGFKAIYTEPPGAQSQWNAQTADILRNAILLLMGNGKTLIDLPTLLNENDFRDVLLENIEKKKNQRIEFATLLDQWGRYKKLARTDQWITWVEPILNRVNPMLSNPRIRAILTKPDGDLDILEVVTKKKILFVRIPQGDFGQDANLLGSLIVSGVKQSCLTLSTTGNKQAHNPVTLYLDNFDNFIEKNTIEAITSETKKFKIGLIAVTKSLQHLPEDFRNQLIINIGTLITFALAKKDGDLLGPQMFPIDGRKVKHQTMANIFNRVNTTPQFELVSDEEKLNIDKVTRQEERTYYAYRMGAEAGLFNLKAHQFDDIPENKVKKKLVDKMHMGAIKRPDSSED